MLFIYLFFNYFLWSHAGSCTITLSLSLSLLPCLLSYWMMTIIKMIQMFDALQEPHRKEKQIKIVYETIRTTTKNSSIISVIAGRVHNGNWFDIFKKQNILRLSRVFVRSFGGVLCCCWPNRSILFMYKSNSTADNDSSTIYIPSVAVFPTDAHTHTLAGMWAFLAFSCVWYTRYAHDFLAFSLPFSLSLALLLVENDKTTMLTTTATPRYQIE